MASREGNIAFSFWMLIKVLFPVILQLMGHFRIHTLPVSIHSRATVGPLAKCHLNGVSLVGQ